MELRQLITFTTIVDLGGFKKAAEMLGYAQSSITAHIKDLEEELEQPLFDRLGKKVILTQAGKNFLPYATEIIQLYTKSKATIHASNEPSGPLTIGASESLMIYWLPTIIMQFRQQFPKVELTLKTIQYDDLEGQLKRGEIDAAVLVEDENWHSEALFIDKISEETLALVQSADHAAHSSTTETMLVTEYTCNWRTIIDQHLKAMENKVISKVELPSIEAIKQCVLCGLGNSMLPYFVVKDQLLEGKLVETPSFSPSNIIGVYAARHKDKWLSPNLKVFLNMLA
ncbi:LysR family transcriptional regulator [Virgibacillus salexigens]|uniref:LysR family transcriptional regulator n=1 Tax=Virgibacillus kapii TaxID=1638645 RepID=A0ABQ2DI98_9BACI|nr:LysR family transcriptional regulator [Virgibacillus kapii]GGJ54704.1 LysR family transcriptional regulator [Virgibacillus kapii]